MCTILSTSCISNSPTCSLIGQDLHKFLLLHFHNKSGYVFIEAHDYIISRNYGATVVNADPDKWRAVMNKGAKVVMSIVVKKNLRIKSKETLSAGDINLCPKCGKTAAGVMRDNGWYQW